MLKIEYKLIVSPMRKIRTLSGKCFIVSTSVVLDTKRPSINVDGL